MPKKKEMTIEDLARVFRERFDSVDKRLDSVDKRLDVVDERFDLVDKRFDMVDDRLVDMSADIGEVKSRLEIVERLILSQHKHRIERLEVEVKNLKDLFALK